MVVAERYPVIEPNLKTTVRVTKKTRIQWKNAVLIKTVGVIIGLVFLNSVIQTLVVQKNYQIATQRNEIQALDRELSKIQVEIAGLTSYERIQHLAKTELGMKLATPGDYRRIAAVPTIDRTLPHQQSVWSRLTAWVGGVGETLANTP